MVSLLPSQRCQRHTFITLASAVGFEDAYPEPCTSLLDSQATLMSDSFRCW